MICGNCHDRHHEVATVRACYAGTTWKCTWLVRAGHTEDGDEIIRECGAASTELPDDRGYTCEAGHSHIYCEVRAAEGWDYASDAEEAQMMRRYGLDAVGPDGGSI